MKRLSAGSRAPHAILARAQNRRRMKTLTRNVDGEDYAHKVSSGIEDKQSLV